MNKELLDSLQIYKEAISNAKHAVRNNPSSLNLPHRKSWEEAYEEAGYPTGPLGYEDGQELLQAYFQRARIEMKKLCRRAVTAELFFAARLLPMTVSPDNYELSAWPESMMSAYDGVQLTLARNLMSDAAITYGRNPRRTYDSRYGGELKDKERERFGKTMLRLQKLTQNYLNYQRKYRWLSNDRQLLATREGLGWVHDEHEGEYLLLAASANFRKEAYYSPFSRIGEVEVGNLFRKRYVDSNSESQGDGSSTPGLVSAVLLSGMRKETHYDLIEWSLEPVERFLYELQSETINAALGMSAVEFSSFLSGMCSMAHDKLRDEPENSSARRSGLICFDRDAIEGPELVDRVREYLEKQGVKADPEELESTRDKFLYLCSSEGKAVNVTNVLKMQPGTRRYGYLLHRFGGTYVYDLLGADHWFYRLLDLVVQQIRDDEQSNEKGRRVEDRVWEYLRASDNIESFEELRNYTLRKRKGQDIGEVDCAVKIATTLLLIEVKGRSLHYGVDDGEHHFVHEQWRDAARYLKKVDDLGRRLIDYRTRSEIQGVLKGVERIIGVVCHPFPHWIPTTDEHYWLRQPGRKGSQNPQGVPRILTPEELKLWLESVVPAELESLPYQHIVPAK